VRNNERYRGLGSRNGRSRCDQSGGNECCKFSEHRNNAVSIMGRERVSPPSTVNIWIFVLSPVKQDTISDAIRRIERPKKQPTGRTPERPGSA
jgi:hypothetical protein